MFSFQLGDPSLEGQNPPYTANLPNPPYVTSLQQPRRASTGSWWESSWASWGVSSSFVSLSSLSTDAGITLDVSYTVTKAILTLLLIECNGTVTSVVLET